MHLKVGKDALKVHSLVRSNYTTNISESNQAYILSYDITKKGTIKNTKCSHNLNIFKVFKAYMYYKRFFIYHKRELNLPHK